MSKVHSARIRAIHPHTVFRIFKYLIYALVSVNAYLFFREDFLASQEVFGNTFVWGQLGQAFSATVDTTGWVVLLLLFELETAVIPDEKLRGGLKWFLTGLRALSYAFIIWAFYGYVTKLGMMLDTIPFVIDNVCSLVGSGFNWVETLDEYPAMDQTSCVALQGQSLLQLNQTQIIGSVEAIHAAGNLAIIDVINAGDWLVIVLMLEVEVYLQLHDLLTARLMLIFKVIKGILYSVLLICAIYWGFLGDFLDFWDAFLWLMAFVFIEMNIFQWHEELEEERAELVV